MMCWVWNRVPSLLETGTPVISPMFRLVSKVEDKQKKALRNLAKAIGLELFHSQGAKHTFVSPTEL